MTASQIGNDLYVRF